MTSTIDTLISTYTLFATVQLSVITFIGGLIIAKGIAQDQRTDKAIEKIEKTKEHIEEIEKNVQAVFNQAQASLAKITEREQELQKKTTELEERLKQADIRENKSITLLSYLEHRVNSLQNLSQGSAHIFQSPAIQVNSLPISLQPTQPQYNAALYANPIVQPFPINPSPTSTVVKGEGSQTVTITKPLSYTVKK